MRASEISHRLARADVALWTSWLRAVQERETNPYGIVIKAFDDAVVLHCHGIPSPHFNRIMGTGPRCFVRIDEMLRFYSERFTPARVDLCPFGADGEVLDSLSQRGLRPVELQTNLFAEIADASPRSDVRMRIREVSPSEVDGFAAAYERAYNYGRQTPSGIVAFRKASIRARCGRGDWRFFAAEIEGSVVAGGVLHLHAGVATMAGGATLPTHRGRGCQRALLAYRIKVAGELGADLIAGRCAVGSVSQRNMEAAGLTTAYTKLIWSHQPGRGLEPGDPVDSASRPLLRVV